MFAARTAFVIVDGVESERCQLRDSVFQGTVLGPPLWNVFFADAGRAIKDAGYDENAFADDLSAYRPFHVTVPDKIILDSLRECQIQLHRWGAANQFVFDASKESFHI